MDHTIKFRGKSADNGKWIIGDLIQYESGEMAISARSFSDMDMKLLKYLIEARYFPKP